MPIDMPNPMLFRPHIPKAPRLHALFGTKYFKVHQFKDDKWPPSFRTTQYKCMVGALGKHFEYKKLEKHALNRQQRVTVRNLRLECRDGRTRLKRAYQGDIQRIRNILLGHKDLQRLYQSMPSHLMVDNINQRTFVKRKENDRLIHKLNQLTKIYSDGLIEKSKLEDRIKFQNEFVLQDDLDAKECRKKLTNSTTRLKALKTITRGYKRMIQTLLQDEIYYQPVLDSLEGDIEEQANFIQHVILLGIPALGKYKKLVEEYKRMEQQTRKRLKDNMEFLAASKKKVIKDNEIVKKIVRTASESVGAMRHYDRETPSMIHLRQSMEEMEKVIKYVQLSTLSSKAKDIYPRMQSTQTKNEKMKEDLAKTERKLELKTENELRADAMRDSLKHNLSAAEITRLATIASLKEEIKDQKDLQKTAEKKILDRAEMFNMLKFSLWNIIDVLRFVGVVRKPGKRKYPNEELKLPLLKFDCKPIMALIPQTYDDESDKLIQLSIDRVRDLMSAYRAEISPTAAEDTAREYHNQYMASLAKEDDVASSEDKEQPLLVFDEEKGDPSVLTRKQIKVLSTKLVEEYAKKEEE